MENIPKPASLVFVMKETQDGLMVLLGRKHGEEIGDDTFNGPGGKIEPGETAAQSAVREAKEELGITLNPDDLEHRATILAHTSGKPVMRFYIFWTRVFSGVPAETVVMTPAWFPVGALPLKQMLEGDQHWVPRLLAGETFYADLFYTQRASGFEKIEFHPFRAELP